METNVSELVKDYIETAIKTGCPEDQVKNFLKFGYIATPKGLEFHAACRKADAEDGPVKVGMGGARGGAKSHSIFAQVVFDDCQRISGLKVLFLRKVGKAATESFEDLIQKVCYEIPHKYNSSKHVLLFDNGSKIITGGYKDEKELASYLGIEYDIIVVEEATLLKEETITLILGSLRSSKPGWRPRMYLSTNPGGIGHAWFKKELVMPYRLKKQVTTLFIPATYRDNPFLNKEYIIYLEGLKGNLGRAWRDGDWDVFEGQAFPMWNPDHHVISREEFEEIRQCDGFDKWLKWRCIDWGFTAPFCCLWITREPATGREYVYRETYLTNITPKQQAKLIKEMTLPDERISVTYADPSMWAKKSVEDDVTSTADEFSKEGVPLTKADNDRLMGKRKVDELLEDLPDGEPGVVFVEDCDNAIRTIPQLTYDEHKPEDVNTDEEDHAYDALRYGQTNQALKVSEPAKRQRRQSPIARYF